MGTVGTSRQHTSKCLKCVGTERKAHDEDKRQEVGFLGSVLLPAFSVLWDGVLL